MVVVIFASFFTLLILAVPIAMAMGFSTILPALIDPSSVETWSSLFAQ